MEKFLALCFFLGSLGQVNGQSYYMDQPSGCGQQVPVGETSIYVHGRSSVAPGNPPTSCILYLHTNSDDSKYRLEITVESLSINDCTITLEIFDHQQAFGQHLRSIGCSSKSTDTMYSTGRYITLKLSRSRDLYQPAYSFTLRIRSYIDEDVVGGTTRVNKISIEVIIPIIFGILILIFIAIILCCCYRQGKLPGMQGRKPRKHGSNASLNSVRSEKKQNVGLENPIVSVTGESRKSFNGKNGLNAGDAIVWSSLKADAGKDPQTGRQRGRSSTVGQSVPVAPVPPPSTLRRQGVPPGTQKEESEAQRSSFNNSHSGMYKKNGHRGGSTDNQDNEKNVNTYLQNKGVKIGIYPDDSLKKPRGPETQIAKGRGSYAEAQGRSGESYAEEDLGRKRRSYTEETGTGHISRRDGEENRRGGRAGTSPSRTNGSGSGRGTLPSRKGTSPSRKDSSPSRNQHSSSSPGRRRSSGEKRRSRDLENSEAPPEGKLKRPSSGFFDNPDEEGYIYSYDHLYPEGEGDVSGSTQPGDSPKRARRGSEAKEFPEDEDGYLLVHSAGKSNLGKEEKARANQNASNKVKAQNEPSDSTGTSYETIEINPKKSKGDNEKSAADKKRTKSHSNDQSKKDRVPEAEKDLKKTGQYSSYDELSEPNEPEVISNPLKSNPVVKNKVHDSRPLGDAESQPPKKKKESKDRKADDEMSEAGSVRYGIPPSAMPANQDPRNRLDSYPYTVGPSAAYNTMVPSTNAPMGQHGQNFISAFQNQTPSQHSSPAHVAGKAAWFVQTTPSHKGPVTHGAFVMHTTSRQPSQEDMGRTSDTYGPQGNRFPDQMGYDRRPNQQPHSSTPHSRPPGGSFPVNQHFSPIEKADRTPNGYTHGQYPPGSDRHQNPNSRDPYRRHHHPDSAIDPRTAVARTHPNSSNLQPGYVDPNISIFDEPGHRAAVMRSGIDPNTGNEVNQVVWTDTMQDPTDPPGPNPNVTRKTITRITTRAGHGDNPELESMNSQLSFQTYADRLAVPQQNDPAFLSPSTSHQRYGGQPRVPEPSHGQEYPGEDNVAFYLGLHGQARKANSSSPRIHEAQVRNAAIRDKISQPNDSFA